MIAESMKALVKGSSVIRAMFEEGNRLAKIYGAENVYDIFIRQSLMCRLRMKLMRQSRI